MEQGIEYFGFKNYLVNEKYIVPGVIIGRCVSLKREWPAIMSVIKSVKKENNMNIYTIVNVADGNEILVQANVFQIKSEGKIVSNVVAFGKLIRDIYIPLKQMEWERTDEVNTGDIVSYDYGEPTIDNMVFCTNGFKCAGYNLYDGKGTFLSNKIKRCIGVKES